jgi:hypothetical protein
MDFVFQGKGWQFPVRTNALGHVVFSQGEQDIKEAIEIILKTARGERVMRPEFGCGIHDLIFEPINAGTLALVEANIREALTQFEPRIDVLDVDVGPDVDDPYQGKLLIKVHYRVRTTNNEFNLVFPFYLKEGNE